MTPSVVVRIVTPVSESLGSGVGERMVAARKRLGLTRENVADLLQIHAMTLANYERGKRVPFEDLPRIAGALNVDLRWLLFGAEFEDPIQRMAAVLESGIKDRKRITDTQQVMLDELERLQEGVFQVLAVLMAAPEFEDYRQDLESPLLRAAEAADARTARRTSRSQAKADRGGQQGRRTRASGE